MAQYAAAATTTPTSPSTDAFTVYVRQFEESEQAVQVGRGESEKARDYFDGKQFTAAEEKELKKRRQPITPENLIKPKVQNLCGIERQARTDPKAYPRTEMDDADAQAATDVLRYVKEDQDLDIKKSRVFENMLIEGYGGVECIVRKSRNAVDPYVCQIAWHRLYYDPHSIEADFSDATYLGYVTWMDADKAKLKWKDKADIIEATMSRSTSDRFGATYEDRPAWAYWSDAKRNRIRVNTHYHLKGGVWNRCIFTLAGELEESAPSPFLDDEGNPECPLILQAAYVDRDNDRYGIVRDMIPLQDEVNKRRSKFLHIVNSRQVRVDPAVSKSAKEVQKIMSDPAGVIVAAQGEVEVLGMGDMATGQFQLLQDSRSTLLGEVGPNASLAGKQQGDPSGRALLATQQAGMTEMTPLLDNLRHFHLRLYRQIWNRVRQYWDAERWVRVTDDKSTVRFVGVNVPKGQLAMQKIKQAVQNGQLDPQTAEQYAQQIRTDPSMYQKANVVAELDVDIDIEEINETPTLQIEQFQELVQLGSSGFFGTPVPPKIVELIIQASNLRDKQKLIEILDQMQQQAAANPMVQQQQQLQLADGQARVQETQSKTALNMARAQREGMPEGSPQPQMKATDPAQIKLMQSQEILNMAKARREMAQPLLDSFNAGVGSVPQ